MKLFASRIMAFLFVGLLSLGMQAHAEDKNSGFNKGDFNVLLEVNGSNQESWHNAINTARQVMNVVGMDKARVEVVAWGPGLKMLFKNSPVADNIKSLSMYGIKFLACGQTMKAQHVSPNQLAEGVTVIPGAVAHIVKRHKEGWTEIHM